MGTRLHLGFSTAVVLLLLHACGGDSSNDGSSAGGTSIDTSGGDVSEAGLTLSIPSGAVSAPVTITVDETTTVSAPPGFVLVGPAYDLGPDGTQFAKPVLVSIELGDAAADYETVTLYHSSDGTSWDPAENSAYDPQAAVVRGFIRHFSMVAPFATTVDGSGGAPSTGAGGAPSTGSGGELQAGGVTGVPAAGAGGEPQTGSAGADNAGGSSGCPPGMTTCNAACVNLNSDPANCSECNFACGVGEACYQGQCLAAGDGLAFCGDGMINGTEQCDDGNNNDLDGCSATCMYEAAGG